MIVGKFLSWVLNRANHTGTQLASTISNLAWILDRANHTGTQDASTITGLPSGGANFLCEIFLTGTSTWTKTAWAKHVSVTLVAPGQGGASGATAAVGFAAAGGGGGNPGAYVEWEFLASDLPATVSVVVGATGIGGVAISTNSTSGAVPTPAGDVTFGTYLTAKAGNTHSNWTNSGSLRSSSCLFRGLATLSSGTAGWGDTAGNTGFSPNLITQLGLPTGGGAAGGIRTTNVSTPGAAGGEWQASSIVLPSAVGAVAGTANGGAGANGAQRGLTGFGGAGGGGGNAGATINGGRGGDGGFPGGGGGGGGGARNGRSSGAGGNGGAGVCVVIQRG